MATDKKQDCFETLKRDILSLALPPGSALDETLLSQQFKISRTPLREILQRLDGLGYVTHERNRGAVVTPMNLETMRSFFQTAPMIYSVMARLAAEKATKAQVDELRTIQASFRKALENRNVGDTVMFNHRFHEKIGEIADNEYLKPSLDRLLINHTRMSQTFYRPRVQGDETRIETACEQHDALIEAIESHDPGLAVKLTQDHWELSRHRIELYVRPDVLTADLADDQGVKRNAV